MALFSLQITNNSETVDFLSADYKVEDGGFDISLPRMKRELTAERPGFYVPVLVEREYRDATLKFAIYGATRTAALANLHKLNRILRSALQRARLGAGGRVQLSYSWDGATNITYFEVYSGDVKFAQDILSVAKVHRIESGLYVIPTCELTLYMSADGYGLSLFSDSLTELAISNPTGGPATGGINVTNPGNDSKYNYVEIASGQVPGDNPWITKLVLTNGGTYSFWHSLYIGHQVTPFPSKIVFDNTDAVSNIGTGISDAGANPNAAGGTTTYQSATLVSAPRYPTFSDVAWSLNENSKGTFFAFLHGGGQSWDVDTFSLAIGIDDYVSWGVSYVEEWVRITSANNRNTPLGTITIPPGGPELVNYGGLNTNLWLGLWIAYDVNATFTYDYMSLLPIGNGFRIWKTKVGGVSALTGTMYDDNWRGLAYIKDGSNKVAVPFYTLLNPIMLEPSVTQRLYFTSLGASLSATERGRTFSVRVYAVPTYSALAL